MPGSRTQPPAFETTSPDGVLRSYWARLDWYGAHFVLNRPEGAAADAQGLEALRSAMRPLVEDAVMASFAVRPPMIERIKGSIESRREIDADTVDLTARLTNPLATHAVNLSPAPIELFHGEAYGGQFRYRLSRRSPASADDGNVGGWRVAEIWRLGADVEPQRIR